jgi:hypothetical protein
MAQEVQISPDSIERTAKIRHPVAVPVLSLITLGIYGIYWWYQINREMVDLGKARNADGLGENATTSLLAVFPGFLIIVPPYVSLYNGIKRMQRAQEVTIGESTLNGWIVLALILGSFVIGIERMQRAQEVTTGEVTLNGWIVLILLLVNVIIPFAGLIVPGYIQSEMNKAWEDVGDGQTGALPANSAPAEVPAPAAETVAPSEPPAEV